MLTELLTKDGALRCPYCGCHNLHQVAVDVFERKEDQAEGLHVLVYGSGLQNVRMDRNLKDNPSPRRNGLSIVFQCETCPFSSRFNIYQHKGETLLKWNTSH